MVYRIGILFGLQLGMFGMPVAAQTRDIPTGTAIGNDRQCGAFSGHVGGEQMSAREQLNSCWTWEGAARADENTTHLRPVPEPSGWILAAMGLFCILLARQKS